MTQISDLMILFTCLKKSIRDLTLRYGRPYILKPKESIVVIKTLQFDI